MSRFDSLLATVNDRPATYIGRVTKVVGMTIEGVLPNATLGATCRLEPPDAPATLAEVVGLRDGHAVLMPLGNLQGLTVGTRIVTVSTRNVIQVGESALGRVLDGLGRPIDGKGPLHDAEPYAMNPRPINPLQREPITHPLDLGVRAINGLLTAGEGQRIAVVSGAGVGKSTLLAMMARHTRADVAVVGLIGERGREVKDFVAEQLRLNEIAAERVIVIAATSDEPPAMRLRGAFTATAVAEYFRDRGNQVLLMMDSLTRVVMAQREIGLSVGEPPATRGYPPSAFAVLPALLERAGRTDRGSITGLYTVLLETEDMQDPIAEAVRAATDGHIVLSRTLAEAGQYPAIDVTKSISRVMREIVSPEHNEAATAFRRLLRDHEAVHDLVNLGAYKTGTNAAYDRALGMVGHLRDYLSQPPEQAMSLDESLELLRRLVALADEHTGGFARVSSRVRPRPKELRQRTAAEDYRRNEVPR